MNTEYKLMRETFIRGHNGSTPLEVLALTTVGQLSNLLLVTVLSTFTFLTHSNLRRVRLPIEYVIVFAPFVLSVTALSDYVYHVFVAIILLTIGVVSYRFATTKPVKRVDVKQLLDLDIIIVNRFPFATNLMASLLLCVCVAILAVDFPIFSRRFAKTELYGWSLMDVGVGGFVAINGGFSTEARLGTDPRYSRAFLIKKSVMSAIPLLVLGFQRLIAVKWLNYHEHVTEYGLHWNFFFTIAFTKLFSAVFCCLFSSKFKIGFVSIILLLLHQIGLTWFGLSDFIQNDDRNGLIAANKEGIISLTGYLSLYLFFIEVGRYVLRQKTNMRTRLKIAVNIWIIAIVSTIVMALSSVFIEQVSRREANLAFICWMISFICVLVGLELFFDAFIYICQHLKYFAKGEDFQSIIFSSIGYSGMIVFLISNLLTGLINVLFDTIASSDAFALIILSLYCAVLSLVAVYCKTKEIQLKIPVKQKTL